MAAYAQSSGAQTADATVKTGKAQLTGVQIITNGTADATLILYDNTAASGTEVFQQTVTGADDSRHFDISTPIKCHTGIRADITGTGATYIVYYA